MKKVISLVTAMVLCLTALTGCGSSNVELSKVMDEINKDFSLSLKQLESVDDLNKYYSINTSDVKQFAAELDQNSNAPTEIVMVEAVDSTAADNVEKALTDRYNAIVMQYNAYSRDKLSVVEACKVTKDGNFVSMIVAENGPEMLETYYEYVK